MIIYVNYFFFFLAKLPANQSRATNDPRMRMREQASSIKTPIHRIDHWDESQRDRTLKEIVKHLFRENIHKTDYRMLIISAGKSSILRWIDELKLLFEELKSRIFKIWELSYHAPLEIVAEQIEERLVQVRDEIYTLAGFNDEENQMPTTPKLPSGVIPLIGDDAVNEAEEGEIEDEKTSDKSKEKKKKVTFDDNLELNSDEEGSQTPQASFSPFVSFDEDDDDDDFRPPQVDPQTSRQQSPPDAFNMKTIMDKTKKKFTNSEISQLNKLFRDYSAANEVLRYIQSQGSGTRFDLSGPAHIMKEECQTSATFDEIYHSNIILTTIEDLFHDAAFNRLFFEQHSNHINHCIIDEVMLSEPATAALICYNIDNIIWSEDNKQLLTCQNPVALTRGYNKGLFQRLLKDKP